MLNSLKVGLTLAVISTPLLAGGHGGGDAAAGEKVFKKCIACHVVQNDAGELLAGRGAKTGPNLYGVAGRTPGAADFRYSKSMVAYGETGAVWGEENFAAYVQDPTGFLKEVLDDRRARGKMSFKLRKEEDAKNVYAYLAQLAK